MAQQFEQPLDGGNLRTQRMTADESRAVIDLWQQEQTELTGLTDKPAVPDVAEGLDITVEDVQRLLQDVRTRRTEEEQALVQEQMLAKTEMQLADEKARLNDIQRQRAQMRRERLDHQRSVRVCQSAQAIPHSQWVEVRPGVWEDAAVAGYTYVDFNRLDPNHSENDQIIQPLAIRFAAALAKVILLSLTVGGFIVAPLLYVLWCIFTGPH